MVTAIPLTVADASLHSIHNLNILLVCTTHQFYFGNLWGIWVSFPRPGSKESPLTKMPPWEIFFNLICEWMKWMRSCYLPIATCNAFSHPSEPGLRKGPVECYNKWDFFSNCYFLGSLFSIASKLLKGEQQEYTIKEDKSSLQSGKNSFNISFFLRTTHDSYL